MSNEALSLTKTPEGGMTLALNLGRAHFNVDVTPAEIAAIRGRIEAWHRDMHARGMGNEIEGTVEGDVREAVLGLAAARMQRLAPPSMMGAAAKTALAKRAAKKPSTAKKPVVKAALKTPLVKKPTPKSVFPKAALPKAALPKAPAPKIIPKAAAPKVLPKPAPAPVKPKSVDPRKFQVVARGIATVATRKARLLAWDARKNAKPNAEENKRGQAFANELFTREGVPTTSVVLPFWDQMPAIITAKVALTVKKGEGLGAPAQLPKPFRLEAAKANLVTQVGRTIANRNAAFVAFQRKSTKPNAVELKNAQNFAKDFLTRNQIPSTSAPNPFWSQSVAAIKVRLTDIVKLAEAQGAPAKPPVPPKPVVVKVDPKKVTVIRKGLVALSARRARFVAFTRKSIKTSAADVQAGKDWARQAFIKVGIPVKLPGRNDFIAGYVVSMMGQAPIVDPTTAFWGQTIATIQVRVNDTLKASETDAPVKLPAAAPDMPTAAAIVAPASAPSMPSVPAPTETEARQAMQEVEQAAPEEAAEIQQQAIEEVSEPVSEAPYYEEAPAEEAPAEEAPAEETPSEEESTEEESTEEPTEEMTEEPTEEALAENIDSENEAADAAEELTADSETETAGEPNMALRGTILRAAQKLAAKRGQRLNKRHVRTAALGIAMMGADSLIAEADAGNPVAQAKIKATVAKANAGSPKAKAATKVLKAAAKRRVAKAKKVAPEGEESRGIVSLAPVPRGIFKRYFQGVQHAIKGL